MEAALDRGSRSPSRLSPGSTWVGPASASPSGLWSWPRSSSSRCASARSSAIGEPAATRRRHLLVVLSLPCEEQAAVGEIAAEVEKGGGEPAEVLVLSPARLGFLDRWASDLEGARREAQGRLVITVASLAKAGIEAEARVGDEDLVQAVEDQLQSFAATEVDPRQPVPRQPTPRARRRRWSWARACGPSSAGSWSAVQQLAEAQRRPGGDDEDLVVGAAARRRSRSRTARSIASRSAKSGFSPPISRTSSSMVTSTGWKSRICWSTTDSVAASVGHRRPAVVARRPWPGG